MAIPGEVLLAEDNGSGSAKGSDLIIGAIELAYKQMDQMVEQQAQKGGGGCTALTCLFFNGRLYASGAGDSRFLIRFIIFFAFFLHMKIFFFFIIYDLKSYNFLEQFLFWEKAKKHSQETTHQIQNQVE